MNATIVDLRYNMKHVLRAIDRGETVTVLYRGKERAKLTPIAPVTEEATSEPEPAPDPTPEPVPAPARPPAQEPAKDGEFARRYPAAAVRYEATLKNVESLRARRNAATGPAQPKYAYPQKP